MIVSGVVVLWDVRVGRFYTEVVMIVVLVCTVR